MSKFPRKSPRKSPRTTTNPTGNTAKAARSRTIHGIDYGPAVVAIGDIATWIFDLAAKDVADWPEGTRRVRSARSFVMSYIEGKRRRSAPLEDVLFTAGILARIFEGELPLGTPEMMAMLDRFGLPPEMVSAMYRPQPSTCTGHPDAMLPGPCARGGVRVATPQAQEPSWFLRFRSAA